MSDGESPTGCTRSTTCCRPSLVITLMQPVLVTFSRDAEIEPWRKWRCWILVSSAPAAWRTAGMPWSYLGTLPGEAWGGGGVPCLVLGKPHSSMLIIQPRLHGQENLRCLPTKALPTVYDTCSTVYAAYFQHYMPERLTGWRLARDCSSGEFGGHQLLATRSDRMQQIRCRIGESSSPPAGSDWPVLPCSAAPGQELVLPVFARNHS